MALPSPATKVNYDSELDNPELARAELADFVDKFNSLLTVLGNIVEADAGNGIAVSAGNIVVDLGTDSGLEFVANKLEVKAGSGISKSSTGTNLDINNLVEDTAPDGVNDFIASYDASATGNKKAKLGTVGAKADIAGLTEDTDPDLNNDEMIIRDASASTNKRAKLSKVGGGMVLLLSATASASATVEFISGIDSTYEHYIFELIHIVPATNNVNLQMEFSTDAGTTWTVSQAARMRSFIGASTSLTVTTSSGSTVDLIDSAQVFSASIVNGTINIWNPALNAGTQWDSEFIESLVDLKPDKFFATGVTTLASIVDGIRFKMSTGNIASGEFRMYGVRL